MECKCETCIKKDCPDRTTQDSLRMVISCSDYMEHKPTNADRIRAMTDEELMQLLFTKISCGNICSFCVPTMRTESKCDGHCRNGVSKWLQQPAEGDA